MTILSRRRFIAISATAAVGSVLGTPSGTHARTWQGTALGARASIKLSNVDPVQTDEIIANVQEEIARLESLFSLFKVDSAISLLNRDGHLPDPDPEFLTLLSLANTVYKESEGAFDPTVQPLWAAYARLYSQGMPKRSEIAAAQEQEGGRIGYDAVQFGTQSVTLSRPGMGLTLNGIAQGYITDRVSEMLRLAGFKNVLVDIGETRALGGRSEGKPWRVGIREPAGKGRIIRTVSLNDRALATSATLGTAFDTAGAAGHILNPRTRKPAHARKLVSVEAPTAALADALSTALCLMPERAATSTLRRFYGCRLAHFS